MTTAGRPFCWPCRHYRPPSLPPGTIPGEWSAGTCAAFPDGIPGIIVAGGFDHRDPHPHDNGVRFEIRTDERFDWDERQTHDFLDHQLRRYRQRERRIKALGMKVGPPARAADKGPRHEGGAMTDAPPDKGALQRFTAPIPVRTGEDADRAAAAWEEYRLTGDPEFLYEAGIWARPELTDLPPDGGERLVAPMPIATGEEGEVVAAAWEEYARTGDGEALHAALGRIYGYGEDE